MYHAWCIHVKWYTPPSQNWSKIKKPIIPSVQWPKRRSSHAASHITDLVFVMSGGSGGGTLSDLWLYNTNQWIKVLPVLHNLHFTTLL